MAREVKLYASTGVHARYRLASFSSEPANLDRILAHAAGAIVVAYLDEILTGNEVRADQRIGVDAGVVIFCDQSGFIVRTEQFHDDVGGAAGVDLIAAVGGFQYFA